MKTAAGSTWIRLAALALPVAVSAPLVAGFLGAWHPAFDALAHLRAHLAVVTALSALPALVLGYRKEAAAAIVLGAAAFATASSGAILPGPGEVEAAFGLKAEDGAVYRLLQLNLRFDNRTPEKVLSMIGRTQPDVVTLEEVSERWNEQLARISAAYPHRVACAGASTVGTVAILSRRPFAAVGACRPTGDLATAEIDLGGRTITVATVHLAWPWPSGQSAQIDSLAASLAGLGSPALLAGDLNATPWSHAAARVAQAGGLMHVGGSTPTWLHRRLPASLRRWIGLPIDHVFAKGAVAVHSVRILDDVGSDHAPVLVEFSLPAAAGQRPSVIAAHQPR